MQNNPIDTLFKEHEIISSVIERINTLENTWLDNSDKYKQKINNVLNFFKEYSDNFHHKKEEQILFPALEKNDNFILDDLIDELKIHHEDFREYTQEIYNNIEDNDFESSFSNLQKYCNELLDHIAIENDELFALSETLFSDEELETMFFNFKDIDLELGEQYKEELENF